MKNPLLIVAITMLFSGPGSVSNTYALPCYAGDSPGCIICFVDKGAWNPFAGTLLSVAYSTMGTVESCLEDGGKPFYQILLGINNLTIANYLAPFVGTHFKRSAWCSETVGYWHREAKLPFPGGYLSPWHLGWQTPTTRNLRTWYMTADSIGFGGRWIESIELDLDNFMPGYNAPCPGAYQQILGFDSPFGFWTGTTSNAHSQVVESMKVYLKQGEEPGGAILTFDMKLIEGNSDDKINNSNEYTDVPLYTPFGGAELLHKNRKIRGWGIDLDLNTGDPLCTWHNIEWVKLVDITEPMFAFEPSEFTDEGDQKIVGTNLDFAEAMLRQEGPQVVINDQDAVILGLPSAREPWAIAVPCDPPCDEPATLRIEFPQPIPYRVGLMELEFSGANVPSRVYVVAKNPRAHSTPPWMTAAAVIPDGANQAFLQFPKGVKSKWFNLELSFEDLDPDDDIFISSLYFHPFVDPDYDDSPDNE